MPPNGTQFAIGRMSTRILTAHERGVLAALWRSRALSLSQQAQHYRDGGDSPFADDLQAAADEYVAAADRLEYGDA